MTFDQLMQFVGLFVTGVTTLWGYRAVARDITTKLQNKVDIVTHQVAITTVHNEKNAIRERTAVLETENKALTLRVAMLEGEVRHLSERK